MNGYFLMIIIVYVLDLGFTLAKHGQPRKGDVSFWNSLFTGALIVTLAYFAIKTGF